MKLKKLLNTHWQYKNAKLSEAYHLVYMLPDGDDVTDWTQRVYAFKSKENIVDYKVITTLAVNAIIEEELQFDFVIRVLGHDELFALKEAHIRDFTIAIAKATNAKYLPQLLNKHRATKRMHHCHSLQERVNEVSGVFYVKNNDYDLNGKKLLIVDDISTSCATVAEMIKTLKKTWKDVNVFLFCLARTKHYDPKANI